MSDRIEKTIDINAPVDRVWRAISDHKEFGAWFRVDLEAPFAEGQEARGQITHPGYEHVTWTARIVTIEPPTRFAFTWHPYGIDPDVDYTREEPTLVEFRLAPIETGTRLVITESGFDKVPAHRREEAFRMNDGGWSQQVQNTRPMPSPDLARTDPAPIFAALGDRTRLALLAKLGDGQARSIAALSIDTALTRQAITKHLHVLQDAGLVISLRVGRESRFACRRETLDEARAYLEGVSARWDQALDRLRAFVEIEPAGA